MRYDRHFSSENTDSPEAGICFRPIDPRWWETDWSEFIAGDYPVLKLKTENTLQNSDLFLAIQTMADEAGFRFEDAAIWVLHRTLEARLVDAKKMVMEEIPWNMEIQHICRVMAMLVCKRYFAAKRQSLRKVDQMIWPLVMASDSFRPRVIPANC